MKPLREMFPDGVPLALYVQAEKIRSWNATLPPAPALDDIPWSKRPAPVLKGARR